MMHQVATGLGTGAAAAAVIAAAWSVLQLTQQLWAKSVGRRRVQAKLLDQLTCGSSPEFIETLLGVAQFTSKEGELRQNTYCLPGAWVMVELKDDEVIAFSITIRNKRVWHSARRLTFGNISVKLGRDTFSKVQPESLRIWLGAHTYGSLAHFYFGNPGQYQNYWLSHNMAGAGTMTIDLKGGDFVSGEYGTVNRPAPDMSGVVINTLTILSPSEKGWAAKAKFMDRLVLGPHHDSLRLAGYWIPGPLRRFRWHLAARRQRAWYRCVSWLEKTRHATWRAIKAAARRQ